MNATNPPFAVNLCYTKLALKKRNSTRESREPYSRPTYGNDCYRDVCPFTSIVAVRSKQKALIHYTNVNGTPLTMSLYSNLSLYTPLYAPFTLKLTKLRTFLNLYAL
jgi:hypothetical protein